MPRALVLGTICVCGLFVLANVAYLLVLPLSAIQHAPADRVATAMLQAIFPGWGTVLMAAAIMVSTFGCMNGLILAGPRVYFSMAQDGLFPTPAGRLNKAHVPGWSLMAQGIWSAALVLPRTYKAEAHAYGSLYSERPYRAIGYPVMPIVYILGATVVLLFLFAYRPATTWPGLLIVVCGIPVYYLTKKRQA